MSSIVIVDDEATIRNLVERVAGMSGYIDIYQATNGKEGLEYIREYRPDTIYTDVNMSEMEGPEMLLATLSIEGYKPQRVVVASGNELSDVQEKLKDYPVGISYLSKPFDIMFLKQTLEGSQ